MDTGATTQGGVCPCTKQACVSEPSRFGLTSTMKPMLVPIPVPTGTEYATTPRCVPGSTPKEKGVGSAVFVMGWLNRRCKSTEILPRYVICEVGGGAIAYR